MERIDLGLYIGMLNREKREIVYKYILNRCTDVMFWKFIHNKLPFKLKDINKIVSDIDDKVLERLYVNLDNNKLDKETIEEFIETYKNVKPEIELSKFDIKKSYFLINKKKNMNLILVKLICIIQMKKC